MKKIQRLQDIIDLANEKIKNLQNDWEEASQDIYIDSTDKIEDDIKYWELVLLYASEAQAEIESC